ncbi:2OG-Fe dioxygenase family protein [Marinihelvus fidelis]|uniref:2OG-Fe dioxygenase family protein n=1 Tax=Marinihelvus fidelis TaxID=2613842 RepID=A0A5N0TI37_9GAMM|nr:2OG-Fe dioxygenase family protein [Marinihelvus fidelis]KAA9133526.1 2OG-Fe dioxygenase family protein [Marinihelvus fidelis]
MNHRSADFLLELGQLPEDCVTTLAPSFELLPPSPYADGDFRLRSFSHFLFDGVRPQRLPTKAFVQDGEINTFQGGVERYYPEIDDAVVDSEAFAEMFRRFRAMTGMDASSPIEVHQMRILAGRAKATEAAPEGVHQDGFRHLAVFVIERRNIRGGEIRVHTGRDEAPFVSHPFDHGEFVVLNDKRFWHSAGAMEAANDDDAYMDLFVLTA